MRQADQHGVHVASYGPARNVDNDGDVPWLDPFSALQHTSSSPIQSQSSHEEHHNHYIELPAISEGVEPVSGQHESVSTGQQAVLEKMSMGANRGQPDGGNIQQSDELAQDEASEGADHESVTCSFKPMSDEANLSVAETATVGQSVKNELKSETRQMKQATEMFNQVVNVMTGEQTFESKSVSEEIWVTPKTSPSNSLMSLHVHVTEQEEQRMATLSESEENLIWTTPSTSLTTLLAIEAQAPVVENDANVMFSGGKVKQSFGHTVPIDNKETGEDHVQMVTETAVEVRITMETENVEPQFHSDQSPTFKDIQSPAPIWFSPHSCNREAEVIEEESNLPSRHRSMFELSTRQSWVPVTPHPTLSLTNMPEDSSGQIHRDSLPHTIVRRSRRRIQNYYVAIQAKTLK